MAKKKRTPPREVAERDDRYMGDAWFQASKSKDPKTQVGAIIVAKGNIPLGTGYNGPPSKMDDNKIDWSRTGKRHLIDHAEINAIEHSSKRRLPGSTIYVSGRPCKDCMRAIVRAEIERVVYFPFKSDPGSQLSDEDDWAKAKDAAERGGVKLEEFKGNINWIRDWVEVMRAKGAFD